MFTLALQALLDGVAKLFTAHREQPPIPLSSAIIAFVLTLAAIIYLAAKYTAPSN